MRDIKKVIIVLNGNLSENYKLYNERINSKEFIIACNGGYYNCKKLNIEPNLIIGDFDSINDLDFDNKIVFPKEKDKSDSEIAVDYVIENSYNEIEFWGAIGNRLDHTIFNVSLLYKIYKNNCKGLIFHPPFYIFLIDRDYKFQKKESGLVSFYPLTLEIKNLRIKNLKYELNGEDIYFGSTITLSNEFIGKEGKIEFDKGLVLVISESL